MTYLNALEDVILLLREYTTQFLTMATILFRLKVHGRTEDIRHRAEAIFPVVIGLSHVFVSEGYCYLMDYCQIAYYPSSNRISRQGDGSRYPPISRTTIEELGENEYREITGFSKTQLQLLFLHLRIPDTIRDVISNRVFTGSESFLYYMVYNRLGVTKLQMSLFYFGGDPRRFSYSIRCIGEYIYRKFYHQISGNSMKQWVSNIHDFRSCIWTKITGGVTIETTRNAESLVTLQIPFDTFRIFGFLDDTGFRTTATGIGGSQYVWVSG